MRISEYCKNKEVKKIEIKYLDWSVVIIYFTDGSELRIDGDCEVKKLYDFCDVEVMELINK